MKHFLFLPSERRLGTGAKQFSMLAALPLLLLATAPFGLAQSQEVDCLAARVQGRVGISVEVADSQRRVTVYQCPAEGDNPVGLLQRAIERDAERDENTLYVLETGGFYLLNGSIENEEPLTIVSQAWLDDDDGFTENAFDRPQIVPAVLIGGETDRPFTPRADLTLRGLYVTNRDEEGGLLQRLIRVRSEGARVIIDDCHLDQDGQAAFRLDERDVKLYLLNSILSNIGVPSNPNNGRGIDDRGNDIDSLVVRNSTFYNLTSVVLRDGGGNVNYAEFDHNTMVNIGQGIVQFGEVTEAIFTNNLVINWGFYGETLDVDDIEDGDEPETFGFEVEEQDGQSVVIRNNNFFRAPELSQIGDQPDIAAFLAEEEDVFFPISLYDPVAETFVDPDDNNLEEDVDFVRGPEDIRPSLPGILQTFYSPDRDLSLRLPSPNINWVPLFIPQASEGFDFTYNTDAASYTAAEENGQPQPLGALTWFDQEFLPGTRLRAVPPATSAPETLSNYPNPFTSSTTLRYTLQHNAEVRLEVFDVLGRRVATLVDGVQPARTHDVSFEASGLPSGLYFARFTVDGHAHTQKMLLAR